MSSAGRIAAAVVSFAAWLGLAVQCFVLYRENVSVLLTLWIVLGFFTITTNVLVGVVFAGVAVNNRVLRSGWIIGGTMLSILLVGVIYALLLHGLVELSGGSVVANALLHAVTPVLVTLFWIFFAVKGTLSWRHPLLWAIYPVMYLMYALLRGAATGRYAYPFIDVAALGWTEAMLNAAGIAAAFLLCAYAVVWIDRRMGSPAGARPL